jgi:hypothetical protein
MMHPKFGPENFPGPGILSYPEPPAPNPFSRSTSQAFLEEYLRNT